MVTPAARREAVAHLEQGYEMSERRACSLIGADRSSVRYRHRRPDDRGLREVLRGAAETHRRFGYRRLHVLLRRDGHVLNRKRTQRLYREEGLSVRRRRSRKRAIGTRAPLVTEAMANARWSVDFVQDQFADGRRFRILNVIDDVTKESLAAVVDTSISGRRVARELTALIERRGKPGVIVSDNGTEFTSNAILAWSKDHRVEWHYIAPGKPMQNGYVESFMYGRPLRCKVSNKAAVRGGCVHVCGLLVRPMFMTAGPDGIRGSTPHQRVALERAESSAGLVDPRSDRSCHHLIFALATREATSLRSGLRSCGRGCGR